MSSSSVTSSSACDVTGVEAHRLLSAEPISSCARAGLRDSNADASGGELDFYRVTRRLRSSSPDHGETRSHAAIESYLRAGRAPELRVSCCSTTGGYLFGDEAAARDRRQLTAPPSARPAASSKGSSATHARRRRPAARSSRSSVAAARRPVLRRLAHVVVRRCARRRHRGAARVVAAVRDRCRPARRVPGRVRQGRHTEHGDRGSQRAR